MRGICDRFGILDDTIPKHSTTWSKDGLVVDTVVENDVEVNWCKDAIWSTH